MPRLNEGPNGGKSYETVRIPQKEIDAIVNKEREKRGLSPIATNSDNKPKTNGSNSAAKAINELGKIADGNGVNDGTAGFADNYPDSTIVNLGPDVEDHERIIFPRPIIQPESYTMEDDSKIQEKVKGEEQKQNGGRLFFQHADERRLGGKILPGDRKICPGLCDCLHVQLRCRKHPAGAGNHS